MDDLEFSELFKHFFIRLGFIVGFLTIAYLCGQSEMVRLFKNYETRDIGGIVAFVGLLMCLTCLVTLSETWTAKIFNFFGGLIIFVFGHCLNEYGLFTAIWSSGIVLCIAAYLISPLYGSLAGILLFVGIGVLLIFAPLMGCSRPSKIEPQLNKSVDVAVEWDVVIMDECYNGIRIPLNEHQNQIEAGANLRYISDPITNYNSYFYGTETNIIKNASVLLDKIRKANPDKKLSYIKIGRPRIPQAYEDKYGPPDIYYNSILIDTSGNIRKIRGS